MIGNHRDTDSLRFELGASRLVECDNSNTRRNTEAHYVKRDLNIARPLQCS